MPAITYPEELPVSQRRDDIAAAIRDHQVVIVAGETGSGKTTQLPEDLPGAGPRRARPDRAHPAAPDRRPHGRRADRRGAGHRRWATTVGYKVRFTDQVGDDTLVKVMTDGILLAEIQHDRMLRRYDTLIIDEAHERSLNIDFILGYLEQLLPRRPDLKVIITSATIDPERFAEHFAGRGRRRRHRGLRPHLPGRGPLPAAGRRQATTRTTTATREEPIGPDRGDRRRGRRAGRRGPRRHPGLPHRRAGDPRHRRRAEPAATCATPRSSRCTPGCPPPSSTGSSSAHTGRRVVLATNVAETSLTVPGIRYVIDPGTARISRYSHRLKVQRLPIEPVSQASANQRKGRCGRTSDGICIRLYSEEDFDRRPEFTDPEILRTNLASVILQMTALGLGDLAAFPFIDPPDRRNVTDGVKLLAGARRARPDRADRSGSPRSAASSPSCRSTRGWPAWCSRPTSNGCVAEVMVIAAALSIQDPRERPADKQQAGRREARPVRRQGLRLPQLPQPLALPAGAAAGAVRQPVPPAVPRRVPQLPAGPRVAGHLRAAAAGRPYRSG